ncbi:MAG: TRAP transporter small permease subunit [Aromatoleum sp.]|jgi:TRAP-type mannitol/chloroaromatic compound transport system permease small subunit|uniref:TRAP transporter small permease subunit n=1 Tax=Aromatoleum sp. TaxID=2307007 RepID=UPI002893DF95|nr:TRAP transporter small permease subunit [Aromatoleum sp.]MDT3668742.1 TRAP transporter small permease subunit [Aromatoleum sp.]
MGILLKFSQCVDALSRLIGKVVIWFILATTVISAVNAIARKAFSIGSNAFLEIQWYLFAAVFMLGAGFAFLQNAHVRIDVLANKLSPRTRNYIDIVGIIVFLLPLCYFMISFSWPVVESAYVSGEVSSNAGGLIRWPVYALVPAGFALLALQALSELIKRIAFLTGRGPDCLANDTHNDAEDHVQAATGDASSNHAADEPQK